MCTEAGPGAGASRTRGGRARVRTPGRNRRAETDSSQPAATGRVVGRDIRLILRCESWREFERREPIGFRELMQDQLSNVAGTLRVPSAASLAAIAGGTSVPP